MFCITILHRKVSGTGGPEVVGHVGSGGTGICCEKPSGLSDPKQGRRRRIGNSLKPTQSMDGGGTGTRNLEVPGHAESSETGIHCEQAPGLSDPEWGRRRRALLEVKM